MVNQKIGDISEQEGDIEKIGRQFKRSTMKDDSNVLLKYSAQNQKNDYFIPKSGQIHLDNIHTYFFMDGTFKIARKRWTIGAPRKRHSSSFVLTPTHQE